MELCLVVSLELWHLLRPETISQHHYPHPGTLSQRPAELQAGWGAVPIPAQRRAALAASMSTASRQPYLLLPQVSQVHFVENEQVRFEPECFLKQRVSA